MSNLSKNARSKEVRSTSWLKGALLLGAGLSTLTLAGTASAQDVVQDEVISTGIRQSLENALIEKRQAASLVEVILAEDIGKLPDQNLAEVLENIPGIQITRTAGVGSGVQIRGTNDNRTEINGVTTVGSGATRSGISFEDVPAAMIAGVEVIKAPEASTIEGAIGGTINLRTIRPLDLKEDDVLANIRIQGEESNLSTDGITPRLAGTLGKKWSNASGQEIGAVVSMSYTEQDVTAFRPRADRDNAQLFDNPGLVDQPFIPVQFFVQDYDNFEYETLNFSGSLEARPTENVKLYLDTVINDQQRRQQSSRIQASGISSSELAVAGLVDEFETYDFGSLDGTDLGSYTFAVRGIVPVEANGTDGNLRTSTETNSRLTDSSIVRLGAEWERGAFSGRIEGSSSKSDSTTPQLNTVLNFINPNVATNSSNENGTPFVYDLTGDSLAFGILQDPAFFGPSTEQLLDPGNYVLRDVQVRKDATENSEDALRFDVSYDPSEGFLGGSFLSSIDAGYRYNKTSSLRDEVRFSIGLRNAVDSPTADLFSGLLVPGPTNFGDGDGRSLFVRDFLHIDPVLSAEDQNGVLAALSAAVTQFGGTRPLSQPTSNQGAFFSIDEKTHSFYGQANFESGPFRGNAGVRYVDTTVASTGNTILNGVATPTTTEGSYDFILPRVNLAFDVTEDIVLRGSYSKDIARPDFSALSTAITFSTSPNPTVSLGNPGLSPQEVDAFDVSASWYFAPAAVFSVGYFNKKRSGLFVGVQSDPAVTLTPFVENGVDVVAEVRDVMAPCEGGGIFNPVADWNVFAPIDANGDRTQGTGICVPSAQTVNGTGSNTLEGIEFSFQYDLSNWEDRIGWASGFGLLANYTHQTFPGSDDNPYTPTRRATSIFASNGVTGATLPRGSVDLSENAYNVTVFYEKHGLSARARYTWRDAYRTFDLGSTSSGPFGFPAVNSARGQLNAGINYDVTDHLNVGIEAVNLTKSDVKQYCVNDGAALCFQGITDRRIIFGASYNF